MKGYVATTGVFDGVHRGHRFLAEQVLAEAERRGLRSMLLTFGRHPAFVLGDNGSLQLLTTNLEKEKLLNALGVDHVHWLDFSPQMARLTAHDFMREILLPLGVEVLLVGYDHHFGRPQRGEGFDDYRRYGHELGIDVVQAEELNHEFHELREFHERTNSSLHASRFTLHVSSSAIRHALAEGNVEMANEMLGYRYTLEGTVVEGHRVGTELGFPTANLRLPSEKLVPRAGVYAVSTDKGAGMLNIGTRPTLDNGDDTSVEVNIFDFDGDLYGQPLRVELLRFLRPEQRFASVGELRLQLERDREDIRGLVL